VSKVTVYKSDKSGQVISDGQPAKLRITFADGRKAVREADLTETEAEILADEAGARAVARRGRKPVQA